MMVREGDKELENSGSSFKFHRCERVASKPCPRH